LAAFDLDLQGSRSGLFYFKGMYSLFFRMTRGIIGKKPLRFQLTLWTFLLGTMVALSGCRNSKEPRHYLEIEAKPINKQVSAVMNASPVDLDIQWTKPGHWITKDSASGLRAGSFAIQDSSLANTGEISPDAIDVSVSYFAGDAGGIKPNFMRWLGQVSVTLDSARLENLIQSSETFTTQTGEAGIFVDFTELLSGDLTQSKSIFGAIVPGKGYTLFVKGMGIRNEIKNERNSIRDFCRSLHLKLGEQ
jgi:hypothetical protein